MKTLPAASLPPDDILTRLKVLTPAQIQRIDELLASVGDFGEVHLIVQRAVLKYINKVESFKADGDGAGKRSNG